LKFFCGVPKVLSSLVERITDFKSSCAIYVDNSFNAILVNLPPSYYEEEESEK